MKDLRLRNSIIYKEDVKHHTTPIQRIILNFILSNCGQRPFTQVEEWTKITWWYYIYVTKFQNESRN